MARGPKSKVSFRRRREGRTNYRERAALLRSGRPRAVVRKSNRFVRIQIITFNAKGDQIIASGASSELAALGWAKGATTTPAAYLTGLLVGQRAKAAGVQAAVLDIGMHIPSRGALVFASLQGLCDAGLEIPHDAEIVPSPERLSGAHLGEDAAAAFESIKAKIRGG